MKNLEGHYFILITKEQEKIRVTVAAVTPDNLYPEVSVLSEMAE